MERVSLQLVPAEVVAQHKGELIVLDSHLAAGETVALRDSSQPGPTYECGSCGSPLMVGVQPDQVTGIVLRCSMCRAYNDATV